MGGFRGRSIAIACLAFGASTILVVRSLETPRKESRISGMGLLPVAAGRSEVGTQLKALDDDVARHPSDEVLATDPPRPGGNVEAVEDARALVADAAGVTPKQRLEFLVNGHDHMLKICTSKTSSPWEAALTQEMFLYRCVGTLLYSRGQVVFPSELSEAEKRRYSTTAESDPDHHVFSQDGAWFEFYRGDFPIFDEALDRLEAEKTGLFELTERQAFEDLYEQAIATF